MPCRFVIVSACILDIVKIKVIERSKITNILFQVNCLGFWRKLLVIEIRIDMTLDINMVNFAI